jgi:hypothetical protein
MVYSGPSISGDPDRELEGAYNTERPHPSLSYRGPPAPHRPRSRCEHLDELLAVGAEQVPLDEERIEASGSATRLGRAVSGSPVLAGTRAFSAQ